MTTIIAVGSQNHDKIESTRHAVNTYWASQNIEPSFEVIGCNVSSGVRAQPITTHEAMMGASNRANAAYRKVPGANFGVGIEGGLHLVDGIWFNQAWVYVTQYVDGESRYGYSGSNAVPVPNVLMEKILSGTEISYTVDEVLETKGMKNRGGWHSVYSRGLMPLQASIEEAIMLAFAGLDLNERFGTLNPL